MRRFRLNQKIAFKIIYDVDKICSALNLNYWLNLGTALGLYRDNKFIDLPGEDVDIGIVYSDSVAAVPQHLKNIGFNIQEVRSFNNTFFHISTNRDGIHVCFDIYHPYPKNKFFLYTETYVYYFLHPVPCVSIDTFLKYKDVYFKIPAFIESWLEFQYGSSWRIPLKKMVPAHVSHTKESIIIKEGAKL